MTTVVKRVVFVVAGAGLGFAYYFFIGCTSGTCPITSSPWLSTAWGALLGAVAAMNGTSTRKA